MNLLWATSLLFGLFLLGSAARLPLSTKYVITSPKVLSPRDSRICLTPVHGTFSTSSENRWVEVALTDLNTESVLITKREPLSADDVTCVELPLSNIRHNYAKLKVQVPDFLDEFRTIQISPLPIGMSMIEVSKPVYKPGDLIKFRIINFDGRMKLYHTELRKLSIYNPSNFKVMEWKNVNIGGGMRLFKHPLALHTVEGYWKIVAVTYDNQVIEKRFEVSSRDPQLYVDLRSEPYIYANEHQQRVVLCAKDKYGVPVHGQFNVVAYQVPQAVLQTVAAENDESGCLHFTLNDHQLGWSSRVGTYYTLSATFTSENPNYVITTKRQLFVVSSPVYLRKPSSKFVASYFKPNLPYFGYLITSKPNSEPVLNQDVQICYESRVMPWMPYSEGRQCQTFKSGLNGVVKFVIPPVNEDVKQLYIEANIPGISGHKQVFTVNPWNSQPQQSHFVIEPRVVDHCEGQSNKFQVVGTFDSTDDEVVFWTRSTGSAKQGITKRRLTKSQLSEYLVQDPSSIWTNTIGDWPSNVKIYRIPFEIDAENDPDWHLERVVVFSADNQGNLMSDSSSWIVNCHQHEAPFELTAKPNKQIQIKSKIARNRSTPCVYSVDTSDRRGKLTERKITKMLEQYDSNNDVQVSDYCAKERKQKQHKYRNFLPLNYHNDWDVFTRGGLIPIANYQIEEKPCGWLENDYEKYNQTYNNYLDTRRFMTEDDYLSDYSENAREWARIHEEEDRLDQPIDWDVLEGQVSVRNVVDTRGHGGSMKNIHLNAICNDEKGMRIYNIKKRNSYHPFDVYFHVDEAVQAHVLTPFTLIFRRSPEEVERSHCVPLKIEIASTEWYNVVDYERSVCACGEYYKVNGHFIPLNSGYTQFNVLLQFSDLGSSCDYQPEARFQPFTEYFDLQISSELRSKGFDHILKGIDIQCHNQPRTWTNQTDNKYAVSSDLIAVLAWKNKISFPMKKNAFYLLSNYLPLLQLYKHNKDKLTPELKSKLEDQLALTSQELYLYRLTDGSYKMNAQSKHADYLTTVVAYTTMAKARELGFHHDDNEILQTYQWLASTLNQNGCVYVQPALYQSWPKLRNSQNVETMLTAFLVSMVSQTQNHEFVTRRAIKCIPDTVEDQNNDILNAMVATVWAHKRNSPLANKFLKAVNLDAHLKKRSKTQSQMFEPDHVTFQSNPEVLEFYLLAALNDESLYESTTFAAVFRELAINEETLEDPIALYAVAKAWLRLQKLATGTEIKIGNKSLKLKPYEWKILENYPTQSKVDVRKGCAVFYRTSPVLSRSQTDAKVEIKNLEIGYQNCGSRMVQICQKSELMNDYTHPTYLVKYPSRYTLDEESMRKMFISRQSGAEHWTKVYGGIMIVPSLTSPCVNVPLVQTYSVEEPVKGYVQVYEGSQSGSDPFEIEYEVPVECSVKNYDAAPVSYETVDCPEGEAVGCPYCMSGSSSSCESANSYIGYPMKLTRRSSKWPKVDRARSENQNEKKCYKFKLQVAKINEKAEQGQEKTFYLRKDCACSPPTPRGFVLTSRILDGKHEHQLGSGDLVSYASTQHSPCNQRIRNRREIAAKAASASNQARSTSDSSAASTSSAKAERGYESQAKGYPAAPPPYEPESPPAYPAAPYPAKAYPAPAPNYEPAYPAPAYPAPAYPAPAYPAPAYPAPAYPAPTYEAPTYPAPAYAPPAYDQQTYTDTYTPAAYPAPVYAPAYEVPQYQAPAYEPAPYQAPAYPAPAYPAPAYPAPAYEPPKGYAPPPPAYEPAPYQAPAYPAPPAYEPPKGYVAPPAYEAPAYPAPAYPAPAYPAPAYPAPPAYAPPAYEAPVYAPPAYPAPPAYEPPAYPAPPSYPAPSYPAPAYPAPPAYAPPPVYAPPPPPAYAPAPAYTPPAPPAYPPAPAYAPPAYAPPPLPAYAPPAYAPPPPPAYAPPPPPAYAPPPPPAYAPPAYAPPPPPAYEAPAYVAPSYEPYRNAGNQISGLAARKQHTAAARKQNVARQALNRQYSRHVNGMTFRSASKYQGSASEFFMAYAKPDQQMQCIATSYETTCPRCYDSVNLDILDKLCTAKSTYVAQTYENYGLSESSYRCGNFTVQPTAELRSPSAEFVPFTMSKECSCPPLAQGLVFIASDDTVSTSEGHKLSEKTMILPADDSIMNQVLQSMTSCRDEHY